MSVRLVDASGVFRDVPDELVDAAIARGYKHPTAEQGQAFETTPVPDDSLAATAAAGISSGLSSATLGGTDVLIDAVSPRGDVEALRRARAEHPIASTVGAVAGAFTGPGAGIGAKLGKAAEGASAGTQIARAAGGYAAEGAVQGLGQGVSELALSDDPVSVERAASVLSSNMLFGGVVGGAAGGLGKSAELGLLRAKGAMERVAARVGASGEAGGVAEDLAQLDAKGLRAARDTELARLVEAQKGERAASVDAVAAYRDAVKEANPWLAINEGEEAALLGNSKKGLRNAFNDPRGLAENPSSLLKPLRVEEQAFERALANKDAIIQKLGSSNKRIARELEEELATLPDSSTSVDLTGKAAKRYGQFADAKVGKGGVTIAREDAAAFLDALKSGGVQGAGEQAFAKVESLLEQNRALQARIKGSLTSKAELASPRLQAIADAEDALKMPTPKKSLVEDALGGTIYGKVAGLATGVPVLGPIAGAKAARFVTDLVFGRLGKATGEAAKRGAEAVSAFLGGAAKAAKASPVLATKVVSSVRYAPSSTPSAPPKKGRKGQPSLADSYLARANEIRSQVVIGPDGVAQMRPEARAAMASRLAPIRAYHPVLADRIETLAARRLEFLAPRLPTKPDPMGLQAGGKDTWRPSDMEMRRAARLMSAVEDPHAVLERLVDGSITPEDAEAFRAMCPEQHTQITQEIFSQLAAAKSLPPYQRRLALSIFTGRPVDPALHPVVLSALQQQFAREDGTEGGTQAPRAQPQFGSVSKSLPQPTPAQKRAG